MVMAHMHMHVHTHTHTHVHVGYYAVLSVAHFRSVGFVSVLLTFKTDNPMTLLFFNMSIVLVGD